MTPELHADFEHWLFEVGTQVYFDFQGEDKRVFVKQLDQHIQTSADWLQRTEYGSCEHMIVLAILCHAYRALEFFLWNHGLDTKRDYLRHAIEVSGLLEETARAVATPRLEWILAEQRLWMCQRYRRLNKHRYNNVHPGHLIEKERLEGLITTDKTILEKAVPILEQKNSVPDGLFLALLKSRLKHSGAVQACLRLDWWQSEVGDRELGLLSSIRLGAAGYSGRVWQWQFERLLQEITRSFSVTRYQPIFARIAQRQTKFSYHHIREAARASRTAWIFWARCEATMIYRGYRVYAAAVARKPTIINAIIDDRLLTEKQKITAIMMADPMCIASSSASARYIKKMEQMGINSNLRRQIKTELATN